MGSLRVGVIGVGTIGAQVLWQLSRRAGVEVTGFETFAPGHGRGGAGGETRLFRTVELGSELRYIPLTSRAEAIWQELQDASGRELRTFTGALVMGSPDSPQMKRGLQNATDAGAPHRVYDEKQLHRLHPQFAVDPGDIGLWDIRSGYIRPELTVATTAGLAEANGARIHRGSRVLEIAESSRGPVVRTAEGEHYFDRLVVAVGGWTGKLLPAMSDIIETRRLISTWHFGRSANYLNGIVPFLRTDPTYCYGIPSTDGTAMKIGLGYPDHLEVEDPDTVERIARPDEMAPFQEKIARYLPGLDPSPMRAETYLETYTATRREWMCPHPEMSDVLVLSGFSGHGFRLCPVLGEIGAQLALGEKPGLDVSFLEDGREESLINPQPIGLMP